MAQLKSQNLILAATLFNNLMEYIHVMRHVKTACMNPSRSWAVKSEAALALCAGAMQAKYAQQSSAAPCMVLQCISVKAAHLTMPVLP